MSLTLHQRYALAGDRLAPNSIFWGTRRENPKQTIPTNRDLSLLALLYDVNFLSASQLTLLGWGRDSDAAGKRHRRLHDSGYIDKFRGPAPTGASRVELPSGTFGCKLSRNANSPIALRLLSLLIYAVFRMRNTIYSSTR